MRENMTEELRERIAEAQMVLVGIGKEMEESFSGLSDDPFYQKLMCQAEKAAQEEKEYLALQQYIKLHYLRHHADRSRLEAYKGLADLLKGKNYFVVSLCTDDLIFSAGLDEARIVTPCGGYRALQCMETDQTSQPLCQTDQESLVVQEEVWKQVMDELDRCDGELDRVDFPVCAECSHILAFNQIETPGYREEGYLLQWAKYKQWLQGTLNRELCVLELGAGMEYPMVIRFPFEKIVFFNRKAFLFRVHSRLYQMTEELKGRGVSIKSDPIHFFVGIRRGGKCSDNDYRL